MKRTKQAKGIYGTPDAVREDTRRTLLMRAVGSFEKKGKVEKISVSSERPCRDDIFLPSLGRNVIADVTLRHSAESIDFDWVRDGIPLRDTHFGEVIARAMDPVIEQKKIVSRRIIWGASDRAISMRADAENGVSTAVSIEADCSPDDFVVTERADGVYDVLVSRWRPLAAAFVPVPADPSVGVNREYHTTHFSSGEGAAHRSAEVVAGMIQRNPMEEKNTQAAEIFDLCGRFGLEANVVRDYLAKGMTIDAVRADILDKLAENASKQRISTRAIVNEMEAAETRSYSVIRAIRAQINSREDAGFEREASAEIARRFGKTPQGLYISRDISLTSGAGLVPGQQLATDYIDLLRAKLVLADLGVRVLDGLKGEVSIPSAGGGVTAYMTAEGGAATGSDPDFSKISLRPHSVSAFVPGITKEALFNSVPSVEHLVVDQMFSALAQKIQEQVLLGDGEGDNLSGLVGDLTDCGAVSGWGGITALEGAVAGANVDLAKCRWLTHPATFSDLRAWPRNAAGGDTMVATIDGVATRIADIEAHTTSTLPYKSVVFGDWSNVYLGLFGAIDLVVDPYTLSNVKKIRLTMFQDIDTANAGGDRFAYSSAVGTDAGGTDAGGTE